MTAWMVRSGLQLRRLALAAALALLALGVLQLRAAPHRRLPGVRADPGARCRPRRSGLSAAEVEQLVTVPLEQDLLNGVPWLAHITSTSMPGLSAIDLVFEPGHRPLPRPADGPGADDPGPRAAQRRHAAGHDAAAVLGQPGGDGRPRSTDGLADRHVGAGPLADPPAADEHPRRRQRHRLGPAGPPAPGAGRPAAQMAAHAVSLTQVIETTGNALWVSPLSFVEASTPGTGGFVETPNQRLGVQHVSPITTSAHLAHVAVAGRAAGTPVRLGDVATVVEDHQPLIGDAAVDGGRPARSSSTSFPDADPRQVTRDVDSGARRHGSPAWPASRSTPDVSARRATSTPPSPTSAGSRCPACCSWSLCSDCSPGPGGSRCWAR